MRFIPVEWVSVDSYGEPFVIRDMAELLHNAPPHERYELSRPADINHPKHIDGELGLFPTYEQAAAHAMKMDARLAKEGVTHDP